jgi:hypothetical protein
MSTYVLYWDIHQPFSVRFDHSALIHQSHAAGQPDPGAPEPAAAHPARRHLLEPG